MATIIHLDDLLANTNFEPPCSISYGVTNETVPGCSLVMGRTTSGGDMRNQRHFHVNCEVGQYRISGTDKVMVGPDQDMEVLEVSPGDFTYIAKGEIHGAVGQGEDCELIFCYIGVSSKEDTGTFFLESPHADNQELLDAGIATAKKEEEYTIRSRIIKAPVEDIEYADPLITGFGINGETVDNPGMVMGSSIMPPGGWNRRHYHVNADVAMYKIKGHDKLLIGPDHQIEELDFKAGDFVFIPKGEIHGAINIDNEEGLLVFCYPGINSHAEGIKVYVEPPGLPAYAKNYK